ncbi:unnamed protein product [Protopolystoma xenopodis]|uniref:Uncharacterized protein n=1 Tax=Protopolystoma xenopodis TaxID=117903 RepID=A0A3S5B044_9PLAT|nr:unnamed protein product [Protopolystoma xenopodis]
MPDRLKEVSLDSPRQTLAKTRLEVSLAHTITNHDQDTTGCQATLVSKTLTGTVSSRQICGNKARMPRGRRIKQNDYQQPSKEV